LGQSPHQFFNFFRGEPFFVFADEEEPIRPPPVTQMLLIWEVEIMALEFTGK